MVGDYISKDPLEYALVEDDQPSSDPSMTIKNQYNQPHVHVDCQN